MGALDGIRVLDFSIIVQGPQAGAMLHDLGADVIKVELPGTGDVARWIPISATEPRSAFFHALNRGKRSLTLDLHHEAAREVVRRLIPAIDIVVTNFTPGTMDRWQLGYEHLSAINPRLIYGLGSAFGPVGPDAEREGADLAGQSAGGLISTTGEDGLPPTPIGVVIADHSGSQNLVAGLLAALYARERTGRGQKVEVSLLGAMIWAQASEITHYLIGGAQAGRSNRGHDMIRGIYRMFRTADGWLSIIGVPGPLWPGFCRAIERPDLAADTRFGGRMPPAVLAELISILESIFVTRTTAEWCTRLRAERQRYAPVRGYADIAADPQVWENGYLAQVDHPEWGATRVIGNPIRLSATPTRPGVAAPELGQHTESILLEAGYTWDEITKLREQGAI